ncbi:MAG: 30S ribosomal protein S8 [Verrucomicrobiales bacterium]|nr:30S ribosomal protein S8 [Verrucomicrobiales bacterium]
MTDPISDMLTRIRNAINALLPDIEVPHSKMKESIAQILKRDGYISDWSVDQSKTTKKLKLKLKYQGRQGVITGLRRVSTPGLRRYVGAQQIPRVLGGMGVAIVSTPKGVMSGYEAQKQNLGGELVCFVW